MLKNDGNKLEHWHIDQRIQRAYQGSFWRYFISQALRLSLILISDDIPNTSVALVLPLQANGPFISVHRPEDLSKMGESLIGWLDRNNSFYAFLDLASSFEYPSDYRVQRLKAMNETEAKDSTLVIVERKAKPLTLSVPVVEIIRRLLVPLYEDAQTWRPYFDKGRELCIFGIKEGIVL